MLGKHLRQNNVTIALNLLYAKKKKNYLAYVLKTTTNCAKQVILLTSSNRQNLWNYFAVKNLSS